MSQLAKNFSDLEVYANALALADAIYEVTRGFPREETYALTDQLRRSSRSIGAQIAEAWGKRAYRRHFFSKLTDADAEQLEAQHWLRLAENCGYLRPDKAQRLRDQAAEIGRMLDAMMKKSHHFCTNTHR